MGAWSFPGPIAGGERMGYRVTVHVGDEVVEEKDFEDLDSAADYYDEVMSLGGEPEMSRVR